MCGICGYIGINDRNLLYRMVNTLSHRGPDDEGFHFEGDVGLGHKRLSIIDLATGRQPISDDGGRFFIAFNGEIYNYKDLRKKLEEDGVKFKTNSDTEVVLYTYIVHGAHGFLKFNGIWGFAIYDKLENKLILCRDHAGVKPLYYYYKNGKLIFASEIKAILEYPDYPRRVNLNALDDYLTLRYVCGENTIFEGIKQLPAGNLLVFKDRQIEIIKYWDYEKGGGKPRPYGDCGDAGLCKNFEQTENTFHDLLSRAVKNQLISEVPLGIYLSGGVDSSVIAALMAEHGEKVVSFSVGFESEIDETDQALKISKYLGTEHNGITVTEDDFDELPKVIWHLDQPLGDAIVLALFKLSSLASKKVKVVLTGEGADELLGGYVHQKALYTASRTLGRLPGWFAQAASLLINAVPEPVLNKVFNYPAKLGREGKLRASEFINAFGSKSDFADKYLSLAALFSKKDKDQLYTDEFKEKVKHNTFFADEVNKFFKNAAAQKGGHPEPLAECSGTGQAPGPPLQDKIFKFEYKYWLTDNILFKQDKLAMAHGIEARVPYLEPEIIAFFDNLPVEIKKQFFNNKSILKNIFKKYIPENLMNVKKKAFHMPLETKFKKSFDKIINEYLDKGRVKRRNYFNYRHIEYLKDNLRKSPFLITKKLMSLAILEIWHEVFNIRL